MALLIEHGSRVSREALAAALRGHGFEVQIDAAGMNAERLVSIDVILICASGRPSSVIASIQKSRAQFAGARIVLVGADYSDHEIAAFIESGARAYTLGNGSLEDLIRTIRAVQAGESPCSGRVGALVSARLAQLARTLETTAMPEALTSREQEVLRLIAMGLSNKEIAAQLSISLNTAKIHVHRILEKLHVRRRREAARWASARASSA